jgi:hypothetical protein
MSYVARPLTNSNKIKPNSHQKIDTHGMLEKKMKSISTELTILDPESLLLSSDPSVKDATEIIEQIQTYYSLIKSEIESIVRR